MSAKSLRQRRRQAEEDEALEISATPKGKLLDTMRRISEETRREMAEAFEEELAKKN